MDKRLSQIIEAWPNLSEGQRNLLHHQAMFALATAQPKPQRTWLNISEPILMGDRRSVHLIGGHAWRRAGDIISTKIKLMG